MTAVPAFSVIIPVFNKWELTVACLRSLREHTPEYDYEVIVADNASSDATFAELPELGNTLFPSRFKRIRFEQNRNFGPACNAAALAAAAPLLFFLNNDTILTPGWAPPLVQALAEDKRLAGVGPLLLYKDGRVQHLGVGFGIRNITHLYRTFPGDHPVARKRRYFQCITAAALLMPAAVFHKHSGFYEEFCNGFEDVDLCLRIHATGKKFSCVPESKIYHLESQTPGRLNSGSSAHNSRLLHTRCGKLYRPDMHLFAREDGFESFINDAFDISCRMREADSTALLQKSEGLPLDEWRNLLGQHPLWLDGRMFVAQRLEEQGKQAEAFAVQAEIAALRVSAEAFAWLERKAAGISAHGDREPIKKLGRDLQAKREDRVFALEALRFVRTKKDPLLESMLEKAIRERFS